MADVVIDFSAPNPLSNVILIVEGKKLHVSAKFISTRMPAFKKMFFGNDYIDVKEVEIKGVEYEEFVDLLNVIHPDQHAITAKSVSYILKLADRFNIKDARDQAEKFLMLTEEVKMHTKIILAEKFDMSKLTQHCFDSFKCINDMRVLKNTSFGNNYFSFSEKVSARIGKKMLSLLPSEYDTGERRPGCECAGHEDKPKQAEGRKRTRPSQH